MLSGLSLPGAFSVRVRQLQVPKIRKKPVTACFRNQVPPTHKTLVIDARRGNSALFPAELHAPIKGAAFCRMYKSRQPQHGSHGHHHHHHKFPPISGVHHKVDPHQFRAVSAEDQTTGTDVTIYGLLTNVALSIGKGIAGVLGNSTAMIADAVHSLGDLGTDIVTLYTLKISSKGPSPSYPYGYGRFDSLGGFVVSLVLIATGVGIGYEAVLELFTAQGEPPTSIALYAAAASVLAKEVLFQMTLKAANKINSKVLVANAWHHRSDAISSALAFLGIAGEMFGIPHMDALAGVAVSAIIVKAAAPVIRDSLDELTDRNDFVQVDKAIRDLAKTINIVVDRLRIRKSGNGLIAEITLSVDPHDAKHFLQRTRDFKDAVKSKFPIIQDMSVELQEHGFEEFHPEHGDHPPGHPDVEKAFEQVQQESKNILPKMNL